LLAILVRLVQLVLPDLLVRQVKSVKPVKLDLQVLPDLLALPVQKAILDQLVQRVILAQLA
jgi:hypothetical protein